MITDKVVTETQDWSSKPLDPTRVQPVVATAY
ncbi:hypothetical protein SAMN04489732_1283 [Amycolatopsis saalfeldensis]|uniref:Uncharacterized protein n=1 Tax=Amycolatopsis saalfeldensis TaxID=394193 RepID=A0A1H8YMY5_9PSEU|nr:hypothetical protein SAMN04489732_1283 [Amycolatopsis saalfeldensis]